MADRWSASRLLWWLTGVAVAAVLLGFATILANSVAEVLGNPGTSLVDGYWRGRLPWIEFGVAPIVAGSIAAAVIGLISTWVTGGWIRRMLVLPPFLVVTLWWLLALNPPLLGGACSPSPCPPTPPDPWAYAYSAPETALLFLVLPSMLIALAALTAGRRQRARSEQVGYISPS